MCYNCGCQNPTDDMGSHENITEQSLQDLAKQLDKSVTETKQELLLLLKKEKQNPKKYPIKSIRINDLFIKAAKAWGQSVQDAKQKTMELLESQN